MSLLCEFLDDVASIGFEPAMLVPVLIPVEPLAALVFLVEFLDENDLWLLLLQCMIILGLGKL